MRGEYKKVMVEQEKKEGLFSTSEWRSVLLPRKKASEGNKIKIFRGKKTLILEAFHFLQTAA